jgi:sporulation protein YlmC with PRC-barrel domain
MFLYGDEDGEPAAGWFVLSRSGAGHRSSVWRRSLMLKLTTASLVAASLALPAFAQNTSPPSATNSTAGTAAPATHNTAGNPTDKGYNSPSERNSALTDSGGMRASKIVGSSVYNDKDEKVASVDDLVIGSDKTLHAVLDVGGVMGIGGKMVVVPFDKLQFGNTKGSSDNRVVMPGISKDALNAMPEYHYANRG